MNYLQLCQELVKELGLAGGTGPSSVSGQQGELSNVTRWIRDACLGVDNAWADWKYLWCEYQNIIPENSREPLPPNNPTGVLVRQWDRDSLVINRDSINAQPLFYEEWSIFRKVRMIGTAYQAIDTPTIVTVLPDGRLRTYPTANAAYPIYGEFWRRPKILTADGDVPLMPEQYHRIVMCVAAIKYGNREDAPEVIAGMEAEYEELLDKLERDQAPGFDRTGQSAQDLILEGAIPGMEG